MTGKAISNFMLGVTKILTASLAISVLASCSPQLSYHGHVLSEADIEQVQVGQSKDQVRLALGTPDTTATVGGGVFYYISSTSKQVAFYKPEIVDRRVLAVYFDQQENVQQVANYGLKDGKVFDFVSRETPSHGKDQGLLKQLFRNLGSKQIYGNDN